MHPNGWELPQVSSIQKMEGNCKLFGNPGGDSCFV